MRINTNTLALNAARNSTVNASMVQGNIEKLSSGLRINRAADDAAGLVISEGMRAQIAGLDQAIRNSNDGINMIKTSEGALNEVHSLLRSMRSLAVHAANTGVNNAGAVSADQAQLNSAAASISRIGSSTQFNGKTLFNGSLGVSATSGTPANASFVSGTAATKSGAYTITVTTAATQAVQSYASLTGITTGTVANVNGVAITSTGATIANLVLDINAKTAETGITASSTGTDIVFTNVKYGSGTTTAAPGVTFSGATAGAVTNTAGVDVVATSSGGETATSKGREVTFSNGLKVTAGGAAASTSVITVANNAPTFQLGANAGQTGSTNIDEMNATVLGVGSLNLATAAGASAAIGAIDAAIADISSRRASLGSFQKNVLESNVNSLSVAKENLSATESTIRDTDMAAEMVSFTKNQILVQASQAMLAQANQSSQGILSLLRG